MKKILISGCLYGWIVRYDAGDITCHDPLLLKWKKEGRLVPVCPELLGGLPVPRPAAQRYEERIITANGDDVTKEFEKGARETVELARKHEVVCCILKQRSPSCGSKVIYDGTFTGRKIPGQGIAAELLTEAGFPVFDEYELDQAERLIGDDE